MTFNNLPAVMPLFDGIKYLDEGNLWVNQHIAAITVDTISDAALVYEFAQDWLSEQKHSENNYKTYRSELTSFLHWLFDVEQASLSDVDRRSLQRYVDYCSSPPKALVTYRNVAQFTNDPDSYTRKPNPNWLPFLAKKINGIEQPYKISDRALKTKLAIVSAFFNFLIDEGYTERNPAMMLLKNGRFRYGNQSVTMSEENEDIRSFSDLQWSYVMSAAINLANEEPAEHERTLFLASLMYACYLRISEVAAKPGFSPVMGQFRRDKKTSVWGFYVPQSKGGKKRTVAVSKELLAALKRYRNHLMLAPLPVPSENIPLFTRHRAAGRGRDLGLVNANLGVRQLREALYFLFEQAAVLAETDSLLQDALEIRQMTPHSIRHTGISHDINLNGRPLSHVQADAGHDSIDTTSQYLHTSRVERHQSAENKPLDHLSD